MNENEQSSAVSFIDITGDQFRFNPLFNMYNNPVYVGEIDSFHKMFEYESPSCDINEDYYDNEIYMIVDKYL